MKEDIIDAVDISDEVNDMSIQLTSGGNIDFPAYILAIKRTMMFRLNHGRWELLPDYRIVRRKRRIALRKKRACRS